MEIDMRTLELYEFEDLTKKQQQRIESDWRETTIEEWKKMGLGKPSDLRLREDFADKQDKTLYWKESPSSVYVFAYEIKAVI